MESCQNLYLMKHRRLTVGERVAVARPIQTKPGMRRHSQLCRRPFLHVERLYI